MSYRLDYNNDQICVVGPGEVPVQCYTNNAQGSVRADALMIALRTSVLDTEKRVLKEINAKYDWIETTTAMRLLLESFSLGMQHTQKSLDVSLRSALESKIHQSFTVAADQMFARGYLDREQRIELSGLIGEILTAFGEKADVLGVSGIFLTGEDAVDIANKESAGFTVFTTKEGLPRWLLISSCNRRDRDQQLISEAGLQRAVDIADVTGYRGPLRWWHTKEKGKVVDFGECDFQLVYKGFLVESGTFYSQQIADAIAKAAPLLRVSIGFIHPKSEPVDGIFSNIAIYERSLLPKGVESNPFTSLMLV